eukprot:CAMPEP_0117737930 /NCGR_PEP_ID=MMETSP0947-20121206/2818_1 /TAXON_ID=44440 /ORGANISM="Chattonella subsalsa, Strain CCMP2191" /LENGTH=340 /DNA_ID=CAMNT_0005553505 /DNA_START=225 /DNA_END=1247 /DNA_ORIENTATION=-
MVGEAAAPYSDIPQTDSGPLFKFGIISDIQYADIEDGTGFSGRPRYYRHSLDILKAAAQDWSERGDVDFAVHLGDILDIHCPAEEADGALSRVIDAFNIFPKRTYHLVGNHCLYNHPRQVLNERLCIESAEADCSYYAFQHKDFVFVSLDGYDISMTGREEGSPKYKAAETILRAINPNEDNLNSPKGLEGLDRRFVRFGGGVGLQQLEWLRSVLGQARAEGKRVVVFCHQPIHPTEGLHVCLLWNYDEVLQVLQIHSDVVVATFAGHAHRGCYAVDMLGIHHKVVEAALECPRNSTAFGHIEVYEDRLVLKGKGIIETTEMKFNFFEQETEKIESVTGS